MKRIDKTKKVVQNSVGRVLFVGIALLLQVFWLVMIITRSGDYFPYITIGTQLGALAVVIAIYSQNRSSASKTLWIALTLVFPVFGIVLFTLLGQPWSVRIVRKRLSIKGPDVIGSNDVYSAITDRNIRSQVNYLQKWCGFPIYDNTEVTYHPDTKYAYRDLLQELKKAEKYIFMEYHAVQSSDAFSAIEDILTERAAAGVDVRLVYDDVGSAVFVNGGFRERLERSGIKTRVFNPLVPFVLAFMNNRDHRKLTVIDGKVGFTGGYNLADEYFNINSPFGYWKDTGIMMKGPAVNSLTAFFLTLWNSFDKKSDPLDNYIVTDHCERQKSGFVLPYADSPLDDERIGENVYLNALKHAERRAWFTTPYLILDDEMISELTLAAKRGVDVRIITPGIPDKKIVYQLTRSYYNPLVRNNVHIFEFSSGFVHAKQLLVDDDLAVIGTINLDYRSLYHHFENGVLIYQCDCIKNIENCFTDLFNECRRITPEDIEHRSIPTRIIQNVLRLFSPLL